MEQYKNIYFASDQHLGAPDQKSSQVREQLFVKWLDKIKKDADVLFLLGDLFDFWFEYDKVVPKGFVRVLGKLAELSDAGITIHFFVGNHDLWMKDYFENELNVHVYREPTFFNLNGKKCLIGHGDGLGPGDKSCKRMKKVFVSPIAQWFYKWLHPDIGVRLAQYLSVKNKLISGEEDVAYLGDDKEWLILYAKEILKKEAVDYFIFGHRHLPLVKKLTDKSQYINTGD